VSWEFLKVMVMEVLMLPELELLLLPMCIPSMVN
jgi:hypothetical protein